MIHILASISLLVVSVVAQISNVTQCIPEYNWESLQFTFDLTNYLNNPPVRRLILLDKRHVL